MESICIVSRSAPYGTVHAAEAVRHALGGVLEELTVRLVLLDKGVNAARKAQDTASTDYESIASAIGDCLDMDVEVYADEDSLASEHLDRADLVEGVKVVQSTSISGLIMESDQTLVF